MKIKLFKENILLLSGALSLAFFIWAGSIFIPLNHFLKDACFSYIKKHYHLSVSSEELSYRFPFSFKLKNISFSLSPQKIDGKARKIELTFSLMQLFENSLTLDKLNIDGFESTSSSLSSSSFDVRKLNTPSSILLSTPHFRINKAQITFNQNLLPDGSKTLQLEGLELKHQRFKTRLRTPSSKQTFSIVAKVHRGKAKVQLGYSLPISKHFLSFNTNLEMSQRDFSRLFSNPYTALKNLKGEYELETFTFFKPSTKLMSGSFSSDQSKNFSKELQLKILPSLTSLFKLEGSGHFQNSQGEILLSITPPETPLPFIKDLNHLTGKFNLNLNSQSPEFSFLLSEDPEIFAPLKIAYKYLKEKHSLDLENLQAQNFSLNTASITQLPNKQFKINAKGELFPLVAAIDEHSFQMDLQGKLFNKGNIAHIEQISGTFLGVPYSNEQDVYIEKKASSLSLSPTIFQVGEGLLKTSSLQLNTQENLAYGFLYLEKINLFRYAGAHEQINGKIQLLGDQLETRDLRVRHKLDSKDGYLSINGNIFKSKTDDLPTCQIDLDFQNFLASTASFEKARLTGKGSLSNIASHYLLKTDLKVQNALFEINKNSPQKLPELTLNFLNEKDTLPPLEPLASSSIQTKVFLDLNLSIKNIDIKGKGLHSKWKGNLKVLGDTTSPRTEGNLKVKEGIFLLGNKRLNVTRGNLQFKKENPNGYADLTLQSQDSSSLTFHLKGQFDKLSISSSNDQEFYHNLSHFLLDKPFEEVSPSEAFQMSQLLWRISDSPLAGSTLSKISHDLFDTLEIYQKDPSQNDSGNWTFKVGKYLTNRLFVSVGKDLTNESLKLKLDVQLSDKIFIEAQSEKDFEEGELAIKWRHAF
ncbi:hypothetical protein AB751O23_AI_00180 [Chlamydiales bacterium SCGC AB-751-O23]|jgi:hypothetical protein|nr:hypothetical protein AB751O23_AI_00180 [Chlamydiales bacterium SCGC AB-751-O23]